MVTCVCALPSDGIRVVSGSYDRRIVVWNIFTGECEQKLETNHVSLFLFFALEEFLTIASPFPPFREWPVGVSCKDQMAFSWSHVRMIHFSYGMCSRECVSGH
jgi:WD40 repeat protein